MRYLQYIVLSLLVLTLDQVTKWWAVTSLDWHNPQPILSILNFALTYNRGAAFSLLNNNSQWTHVFFISLTIIISLVLLVWLKKSVNRKQTMECVGLSLILGGAWGNLFDRFYYGYVIDFIDVHLGSYHWPVFNVADSAICIGAITVLIIAFYDQKKFSKRY